MASITDWTISEKCPPIPAIPEDRKVRLWIPYVRVSTTKQEEEGASLEVQELAIKQFALEKGLLLADTVRESRSAESVFGRPALVDALDRVLNNEAAGLIALCRDRVTRDIVDRRLIVAPFKRAGRLLEVHAVATDDSADGRFVETILAAVEERERLRIVERTRVTFAAKKAQGHAVGCAPYGFNYQPGPRGSVQKEVFVPEWPDYGVWLFIRGMVASCEFTIQGMIDRLHEEGVPPPRADGSCWRLNNTHRIIVQVCKHRGWPTRPHRRAQVISETERAQFVEQGAEGLRQAKMQFAKRH